jgi:hypothetical protein
MGRNARAVLRYACALVVGGLVVTTLAAPALAVDPTPSPAPGIDPGSVTTLAPPSQQQIDDAKNALDRLRRPTRVTPSTPATTLTQVAAPVAPPGRASVTSRISDQAWWTIGAGALVLIVLSETTRIRVRRGKHRKA